jgi:hypothetical protein
VRAFGGITWKIMKHVIRVHGGTKNEVKALADILVFDGCRVQGDDDKKLLVYNTHKECEKALDRAFVYLANKQEVDDSEYITGNLLVHGDTLARIEQLRAIYVGE